MQLTVKDVARYLNVSRKTVYRWIQQGEIPTFKLNETFRFHRAELLEWANARGLALSPEIFEQPESGGQDHLSLAQALVEGGIHYRVAGADQETVIRNIVNLLPLPARVSRDYLAGALMAREAMGSTGIGDGIAIPHVRNPIVLQVDKPSLTLCFLETPVNFAAPDGKPVQTIFLMISTTGRAHLQLLARLARVLKHPAARQAVIAAADRETLIAAIRGAEAAIEAAEASPPAAPQP